MFRVATYNLENLDEDIPGRTRGPSFAERAATMRPSLERIQADIICFQEVNGQEREGNARDVLALKELLRGSRYESYRLPAIRNEHHLYSLTTKYRAR